VEQASVARTLPPQKLTTSIKAPANPYLIQDFIVLLPSLQPLAIPVASRSIYQWAEDRRDM